jgi:hypothetical protein
MRVWLLPLAAARATTCPSAVPTAAPTVVTTASNVSCGFDGGWCGWDAGAAVDGASAAWARASGSTTTRNTGPSGDASGAGSYAFVESSYPNHPAVVFELLSPEFAAADVAVSFAYSMYGATTGSLAVDALRDYGWFGDSWDCGLWELSGDQGDGWRRAEAVVVESALRLRIRATTGDGMTGDMAVDDVAVTFAPTAAPTASRPPNSRCTAPC